LNELFVFSYPDNGLLLFNPFSTLYHAYHRNDFCLRIVAPEALRLELEDDMDMNMNLVDGLSSVVKEMSAGLKEVDEKSSEEEKLDSEDIPMATSDLEVDELIDDETAHLILHCKCAATIVPPKCGNRTTT
jgi:hypothetical protein